MTLLCIIGNIAVGKSTVIDQLKQRLPDYNVFKIDDFRKAHLAYTAHGERMAQNALKMKIIDTQNSCIYESTGISKHFYSIVSAWQKLKGNVVIVLLDAPLSVAQTRYWNRKNQEGFRAIPFPYYSEVHQAMENLDVALEDSYYDYIFDTSQKSAAEISAAIFALQELDGDF